MQGTYSHTHIHVQVNHLYLFFEETSNRARLIVFTESIKYSTYVLLKRIG